MEFQPIHPAGRVRDSAVIFLTDMDVVGCRRPSHQAGSQVRKSVSIATKPNSQVLHDLKKRVLTVPSSEDEAPANATVVKSQDLPRAVPQHKGSVKRSRLFRRCCKNGVATFVASSYKALTATGVRHEWPTRQLFCRASHQDAWRLR
jgi:hypothetical protein